MFWFFFVFAVFEYFVSFVFSWKLVTLTTVKQKWYGKRGGCVYVCICVIAFMCVRCKGCIRPQTKMKSNEVFSWYFSPQGSHMFHTNPPVSKHVTHYFSWFWRVTELSPFRCMYVLMFCFGGFCLKRWTWS